MAVRGGLACIKQFLVIFNSILGFCGLVLLIFSFWVWISNWQLHYAAFYIIVFVLMGIGAFVVVLGALGCFGPGLESSIVLKMYFSLLLFTIVVQLTVITMVIIKQDMVIATLQDLYTHVYVEFLQTEQPSLGLTLLVSHHILDCCGSTGVLDQLITKTCPARSGLAVLMLQPCSSAIAALFKKQSHIIYGAWIGLILLTVLNMIFTVVLMVGIRRSRQQARPSAMVPTWQCPQQQSIPPFAQSTPAEVSSPYQCNMETSKI